MVITAAGPEEHILVMVVAVVVGVDMPRILTELLEEEEPLDMVVLVLVDMVVNLVAALLFLAVAVEVVVLVDLVIMVEEVVELAF